MASPPLVSVIIPVRNDAARLGLCLDALAAQSWPAEALEVVVVDDGSLDDPAAACRGRSGVTLIRQAPAGINQARNRALEASRGSVIACTDADCLPAPSWIEAGVRCLEANPGAGLVAGHVEMLAADPAHVTAVEWVDIFAGFDQRRCVEFLHFGATANTFTTRTVMEELGTFDASLESGADLEWGQRAWRAGWTVVYCPDAIVTHPTRTSWPALSARTSRVARGQHTLAVRHGIGRAGLRFVLGRLLRLPVRTAVHLARDPRIHGTSRQVKVALGLLRIHLVTWWTRLTLALPPPLAQGSRQADRGR
ncbi:MAG: glycosyltransferase [Thermoanaerobaculaceae bacterium]|jgi:cellulose synthase/poly-beta-1,6-N-acetylglucosamine synthase-like glycosyltransferase|nr:glycosyltransferase [Thermoanaerobaculaceae bacterium]